MPAAGAGAAVREPPRLQKVPVSQRGAEHPGGPAQQPQPLAPTCLVRHHCGAGNVGLLGSLLARWAMGLITGLLPGRRVTGNLHNVILELFYSLNRFEAGQHLHGKHSGRIVRSGTAPPMLKPGSVLRHSTETLKPGDKKLDLFPI